MVKDYFYPLYNHSGFSFFYETSTTSVLWLAKYSPVSRVEQWMEAWVEDRGKVRPGKRRADTEMRMEDRV